MSFDQPPRHNPFIPDPNAKYRQVAKLFKAGKSGREIMSELQITRRQLHAWTFIARQQKLLPPVVKKHTEAYTGWLLRHRSKRLGRMIDIFQALNEEEREWLMREIPADLTVAEFMVALIRDARAEE